MKCAIIYYSATGTTYKLAQAVAEGARESGAEVRILKVGELAPEAAIATNEGWTRHRKETQDVPEASNDDLTWADVVFFGTPTRYGLPTAQLKQFIDGTGPLWAKGLLADKVYSSFTSTATAHGGHESTLIALNNTFYHWGGIIVSPGYTDAIQFQSGNPYGTSFTSNNGSLPPDDVALQAARYQGRRVVGIATQLRAAASTE